MLRLTPTWAVWCNGNTPQIRVEYGWGHEHKNLQYLQNGARHDQGYYDGVIGSWMTLNGHNALLRKKKF